MVSLLQTPSLFIYSPSYLPKTYWDLVEEDFGETGMIVDESADFIYSSGHGDPLITVG